MAGPGTPGWAVPAGEDYLVREIAALKTAQREGMASIAASFGPVVAALQAQDVVIAGQVATIAEQQTTLAATVADLASRVSVTTSLASFNTGSLPNDSLFHEYGTPMSQTISVPTGRLTVTVGCGQATVSTGGGSVTAEATFSVSGDVAAIADFVARAYGTPPTVLSGSSLMQRRAFVVPPGTYTITGNMRAWATGSSTGNVQFTQPYLTVEVTG